MYKLNPTDKQIDAAIEQASDAENDGISKFSGMTYEQGVLCALRWAIGEEESDPLSD